MSRRLDQLRLRRECLVARAAEERAALAATGGALPRPGRLVDRLFLVTRVIQAHPGWAVAALTAGGVLMTHRRRAALWLGRAWMVWRAWRTVQSWLKASAAN